MTENPYQAPEGDKLVNENAGGEDYQIAGRGTRLGATLLDSLIMGVPVAIGAGIGAAIGEQAMGIGLGIGGLFMLAVIVYNIILLNANGQTVGKKILNIKIVRTNGEKISLGRIIGLRILPIQLISAIPVVGGLIGLVNPLLIFRDSNQCLHDQFADSIVIVA